MKTSSYSVVRSPSVDTLQHSWFSNVGWRSTSQKSSDNTLRRLLSGSVVSIDEIRGKTPQSGYKTKRITSKKLGDRFQEKLKASQSIIQVFYSI